MDSETILGDFEKLKVLVDTKKSSEAWHICHYLFYKVKIGKIRQFSRRRRRFYRLLSAAAADKINRLKSTPPPIVVDFSSAAAEGAGGDGLPL
jgi:hypothetical protein